MSVNNSTPGEEQPDDGFCFREDYLVVFCFARKHSEQMLINDEEIMMSIGLP